MYMYNVHVHCTCIYMHILHISKKKNLLKGEKEQGHNDDDDSTEHEDADLIGGHESPTTPESVVSGKPLILSLGHDELVLGLGKQLRRVHIVQSVV